MSYLGKGRKEDLRCLAFELQLTIPDNIKVVQLKELITSSANYDEELTKNMLTSIIEERLQKEELEAKAAERVFEEEKLAKERTYELERLKLQADAQRITQNPISSSHPDTEQTPKFDLKRLLPKFDLKDEDISLFLNMFERQLRFLNVPKSNWVPYLVGSLPTEVGKLIVREPEEEYQEYEKVKEILLRRYRLTADKFRQLFSSHSKSANGTWRDFYFELNNYLEGWLSELKVNDFNKLKALILADQIKKRVPPEVREHFIDTWTELNSPIELAEKLDTYDCLINNQKKATPSVYQKKVYPQREESFKSNTFKQAYPSKFKPNKNFNNLERSMVTCYGCGTKGFIKAKCPHCNPSQKDVSARFETIQINNITKANQTAIVDLRINGIVGTACADSGASHSFAGEKLYQILQEEGALFESRQLTIALADGSQEEKEVRTTCVSVSLEGRSFPLTLYALPEAKGNRTLLGTDFIKKAGMVLNLQDNVWFFKDSPKVCFPFSQNSQTTLTTNREIQIPENPVELRAEEGSHLNKEQRKQINALLTEFEDTFRPGGELTPEVVTPCIHPDYASPVERSQAWKASHPLSIENPKRAEQPPQSDQTSVTVAPRSPNGNEVTRSETPDVSPDEQQVPVLRKEVTRSVTSDMSRDSYQMLTQHPQGDNPSPQIFEPVVDTTPTGMESDKVTRSATSDMSRDSYQMLTQHHQGHNPSSQVFEPVVDTTPSGMESDTVIQSASPDVSRKSCRVSNQHPPGDNPSPQVLDLVVDTTPTGMKSVNTGVTSTHTSVISDSKCAKTNCAYNGTPTAMDGDNSTSTGNVTVYFVKTVHLDPKTVYFGRRPKF